MISARPTNTREPSISGTASVGSRLQANSGEWAGEQPITYSYIWLRCSTKGDNCSEIQGANDTEYEVRDADSGHTIRVRVIARNDRGSTSAISNQTAASAAARTPNPSGGLEVGQLQAAGDRLVVAQVLFSPNPVTSNTAPITARVKVTARGGRAVSGARVFMRGTPRVVQGQTQVTQGDGWATLTLVPERAVPAAAERLQRAVLREGVPCRRPGARRDRRLPPRAGAAREWSLVGGANMCRGRRRRAALGVFRAHAQEGTDRPQTNERSERGQ